MITKVKLKHDFQHLSTDKSYEVHHILVTDLGSTKSVDLLIYDDNGNWKYFPIQLFKPESSKKKTKSVKK